MIILISSVSSFLSGMGIGGGAIFILLATTLLRMEQKEAQILNLISFLAASSGASFSNIKNKEIDLKSVKKILPFMLLGSLFGTYLFNKIDEQSLIKMFNIFLLLIGIYEIFSSVKKIIKAKNIDKEKKGEK